MSDSKWRPWHKWVFGAAVAVIVGVQAIVWTAPQPPAARQAVTDAEAAPEDPGRNVTAVCRMFMERQLHDPDSAEWPHSAEWRVSGPDGAGVWRGRVEMRVKNEFGARVLKRFDCRVVNDSGDHWTLVGLTED